MTAPVIIGCNGRLEPLSNAHASDIYRAVCNDDTIARAAFMGEPPPQDESARESWLNKKIAPDGRVYFACVDPRNDRANGFLAYMRDEPAHRSVEIGDNSVGVQRVPLASL